MPELSINQLEATTPQSTIGKTHGIKKTKNKNRQNEEAQDSHRRPRRNVGPEPVRLEPPPQITFPNPTRLNAAIGREMFSNYRKPLRVAVSGSLEFRFLGFWVQVPDPAWVLFWFSGSIWVPFGSMMVFCLVLF